MDPNSIMKDAKSRMDKAVEHLHSELRGVRTGRASTALVEFVKVNYYGSMTDLKSLASISVPEPTQILIKPFDTGALGDIKKALESSDLGFNPMVDGKSIRLNIPALSTDRRKQLVTHVKKVGEETKVSIRNVRRDANKHIEQMAKAPGANYPEDQIEGLKKDVQDLLKKHEEAVDKAVEDKSKEVMTV